VFAGSDTIAILYNTTPFPSALTPTQVIVFTPLGLPALVLLMAGAFLVALRLRD
jgi:hypothetical protein